MASGLQFDCSSYEMRDRIYITDTDCTKLRRLIAGRRAGSPKEGTYLNMLEEELDRAEILGSEAIPPDVVTMDSEVVLCDVDSGEERTYKLVFPTEKEIENAVSILAPIGTAMLGYPVGTVIEWPVPKGTRRLKVVRVISQPEASARAN